MTFYLGTHMPHWLEDARYPLFVSRRRLYRRRRLPRAARPWALDSGAFSEITQHGRWTITPAEYAGEVRRYRDEIGNLDWAATMDVMCEPWLNAGPIHERQRVTVENFVALRDLDPGLPIIPVLQGWAPDDYLRCMDMYVRADVNLADYSAVGVGSVCRRQGTAEIADLLWRLSDLGLALHGFGVKLAGLRAASGALVSADSMAWSYAGRREKLPSCRHAGNCANCRAYADRWRAQVMALPAGARQLALYD